MGPYSYPYVLQSPNLVNHRFNGALPKGGDGVGFLQLSTGAATEAAKLSGVGL